MTYEAAKGSFDEVVDSLTRTTHAQVGKRQAEQLAVETAVDFDEKALRCFGNFRDSLRR